MNSEVVYIVLLLRQGGLPWPSASHLSLPHSCWCLSSLQHQNCCPCSSGWPWRGAETVSCPHRQRWSCIYPRAEVVLLSSADHCLLGYRNGPLEKRHFQKTGEIHVGVCCLSHGTDGVKNPDWLCHNHGYKCCIWLFVEGCWDTVQHLCRLYRWPCIFWDLVLFKEGDIIRLKREINLLVSWNLSVRTCIPVVKTLQCESGLWKHLSLC